MNKRSVVTSKSKYNQIDNSKSTPFDNLFFKKISTSKYSISILSPKGKLIFIGSYFPDSKAFVSKRNENHFHRNLKAFGFNAELIEQTIYPIDFVKVYYDGINISEYNLVNDRCYYTSRKLIKELGLRLKFVKAEPQYFLPLTEFSNSLNAAKEKISIQGELF